MTSLLSVMFQNRALSIAWICPLLINVSISTQTFYKLAGKDDDATVPEQSVPYLIQSFFTCGSNEGCTKVAKTRKSSDVTEVIRQQNVKVDAVVYGKLKLPTTIGNY